MKAVFVFFSLSRPEIAIHKKKTRYERRDKLCKAHPARLHVEIQAPCC